MTAAVTAPLARGVFSGIPAANLASGLGRKMTSAVSKLFSMDCIWGGLFG